MNPEGGGLHIPGLSYVNVDSVEHVNEVRVIPFNTLFSVYLSISYCYLSETHLRHCVTPAKGSNAQPLVN